MANRWKNTGKEEPDAYDRCIEALLRWDIAEANIQSRRIPRHAMQRIADEQIGAMTAIWNALEKGDLVAAAAPQQKLGVEPLKKLVRNTLKLRKQEQERPEVKESSAASEMIARSDSKSESLTESGGPAGI